MVLDQRGYRTTTASGLGMILIGLAIAILGYFGSIEEQQIKAEGIQTKATIVSKGTDSDREHPRRFFNMTFLDRQSQSHAWTRNVDDALWQTRKVGDQIAIKYLPDAPRKARMVDELQNPFEMLFWLGSLGAVMAAAGIGFIVYAHQLRPGTAPTKPRELTRT